MSQFRFRRWIAGLIVGLVPAASASAQGLPPAMTPPPSGVAVMASPVARPAPPVVLVPPEGVGPIWGPEPIDPVALERRDGAKVSPWKLRSWHWRRVQGKFLGYPEDYQPRPLGAALYENGKIMAANGAAARLVLYRYDFIEGTSELNPRGLDQLAKISAQLAVCPYPLIIERTTADPGLAESRRYAVLSRLARGSSPVTSERVLVGVPTPNGMSGTDAQIIAGNSLGRTQQYGPPIPLLSNGVNSPGGVTGSGNSTTP